MSRAGRTVTGVDRVELAYLDRLLAGALPVFALVRVAGGFALLDRAGMMQLRAVQASGQWGAPRGHFRFVRNLDPRQRAAQSLAWRLAQRRCLRRGLGRMLARALPERTAYLNVGHSNLTPEVLAAVRRVEAATVAVLLHDTIPLDFPEYSREGAVARFRTLLGCVGQADLVLCNSAQTRADLARHLGEVPPTVVAPLGVPFPELRPESLPGGLPRHRPYFITVGTIEPRKNHALLLDVWEELARRRPVETLPVLLICGRRGWRNEALFDRLDSSPLMGRCVFELPDLDDGAIAALNGAAQANLFPSFAEGFGLPPAEAALIGTPVICSDLPVLHEVMGEFPVYLDPADRYAWTKEIMRFAARPRVMGQRTTATSKFRPPTWEAHFQVVLNVT